MTDKKSLGTKFSTRLGTRLPRQTLIAGIAFLALQHAGAFAQDAAAGEKVFSQCKICHQVGEKAKSLIAPQLNGIVGRAAGKADGYTYSPAIKGSGIAWDEGKLREYLRDPAAMLPGNKMAFAGLQDDQSIGDLIAFLKKFDATGKLAP